MPASVLSTIPQYFLSFAVSMVEGGLGVALVPLLPTGTATAAGGFVVRPIHSGLLTRRGDGFSGAARTFVHFLQKQF